jgi:hypothetical protein
MTQYTTCADIIVSCPQEEIRKILQYELFYSAFKITWFSSAGGIAYQGSRGANLLIGSIVQYYEIAFQIQPLPDKTNILRLIKSFKGSRMGSGRWLDYSLIEKKFLDIANKLSANFYYKGWLVNTIFI